MILGLLLGIGFAAILAGGYLLSRTTSEGDMTIQDFAVLVTKYEGKKKEVNVAQVKEILKVVNFLLRGRLYSMIKGESKTYLSEYAMPILNGKNK